MPTLEPFGVDVIDHQSKWVTVYYFLQQILSQTDKRDLALEMAYSGLWGNLEDSLLLY